MDSVRKAKPMERFSVKLLAVLFLCVLGVVILIGGFHLINANDFGIYSENTDYYHSSVCYRDSYEVSRDALVSYLYNGRTLEVGDNNYGYIIYKYDDAQKKNEVYRYNIDSGVKIGFSQAFTGDIASGYYYEHENPHDYDDYGLSNYEIEIFIRDPLTATDDPFYKNYNYYNYLKQYKYWCLGITLAAIIVFVLDLIWLIYSSGHDINYEGYYLNWFDKIPFDVFTAITVAYEFVFGFIFVQGFSYYERAYDNLLYTIGLFILLIMMGLGGLAWLLSFVKRVKAGDWYKNTVIYKILYAIIQYINSIALIWKVVVVAAAYFLGLVFIVMNSYEREIATVYLLVSAVLLAFLLWWMANAQKLKNHAEMISKGEYEKLDSKWMPHELKQHLDTLDSIQDGLEAAVEKHLKAERLKTDLITNVSHDIKTPLTSIINYVDLLKKKHTKEDEAKYLEVLDRQSARLKKLTEDLIEASKASTGNISVEYNDINVKEIIEQSLAEYREKFEKSNLEIVTNIASEELMVKADGNLLWRILNNLYSNLNKYALPGTRVYIDAQEEENDILISVKNISKDQLNISPDELMERFVRGDSSRHTEGSGLGLNIANSLAEIMHGSLKLTIDGDLFKTELRLPK